MDLIIFIVVHIIRIYVLDIFDKMLLFTSVVIVRIFTGNSINHRSVYNNKMYKIGLEEFSFRREIAFHTAME